MHRADANRALLAAPIGKCVRHSDVLPICRSIPSCLKIRERLDLCALAAGWQPGMPFPAALLVVFHYRSNRIWEIAKMPIAVDCTCGRPFRIKDELAGKKVRCPECKSILAVPEQSLGAEFDYEAEVIPEPPAPAQKAQPAPAPFRKVQPIRLPDEYAPSRTKSDYESEDALQAKFTGRKPKKRKAKKSESGWLPAISVNPAITSGVLMMIGAVVWFFAGLAAGIIFFYPPVLFFFGVAAVIKGFTGRD
jgi:hypothetical protein